MFRTRRILVLTLVAAVLYFPGARADFEADLIAEQVVCNVVWRTKVGTADRMATTSSTEAAAFSFEGQLYYAPDTSTSIRQPLYRLYNGSNDHMMSTSTNEGGYTLEGAIVYPWKAANAPQGTTQIFRGWNSSLPDHGLMVVGYLLSGYTAEYLADRYAYPRYASDTSLGYTLTGAAITLTSNLISGGAVSSWVWNNKEFVNMDDYGRLIQSSLSFQGQTSALPTEGGDKLGPGTYADNRYWHGSPLLSKSTTLSSAGKTQTTRAIPLEWHMDVFGGATDKVVVYRDWYLGKNVTLDDTNIDLGASFNYLRPQIARYETVFYTSLELPGALIEIPTAYLEPEFSRFFTIDATEPDLNLALDEITSTDFQASAPSNHYQFNNPGAGGVVLITSDLNYAMGVYGLSPVNGGDASFFTLFDFTPSTTKLAANYGPATLTVGEHVFTTFIITGTLDDVRVAMRVLYLNGY